MLGASIGGGEFSSGPAVFVRHGLSILWIPESRFCSRRVQHGAMRYTLRPAIRPSRLHAHAAVATLWGWVYGSVLPADGLARAGGNAAGAIFFCLQTRRLADPLTLFFVYVIGVGTFLACVAILLVGRRIERTLELLNWGLVTCIWAAFSFWR